jgi:hypothetical protein
VAPDEPTAPAAAEPEPPRPRRRRRWPWVLLALAILGVVGLRALLPVAVERGAAWGSRQYLGLPVRIANVDFALLEGRVVLEGIAVAARPDATTPFQALLEPPPIDPAAALLHVERVATQLSFGALRERTARLTELVIERPALRAEREADGTIDPLRHAQPAAPPAASEPEAEPTAEPAEPAEPWTLALDRFALRAPELRVVDAAGGEALVEFALDEFSLTDLVARGADLALGGLGIDGPVLRVRRSFVFAEAPAAAAADPEAAAAEAAARAEAAAPAPAPAAGTPAYRVDEIDIRRATFTWVTDHGPLDVALTLRASNITADEGERFPIELELELEDGVLGLAGEVGVLPPSYTGKFRWERLPFPALLLAALPELSPWLRSLTSDGDLAIDADLGGGSGPPAVRIAGRTTLDRLAIADPEDREVALGWTKLEVAIEEVVAPLPQEGEARGPVTIRLDSLALTEPKILYTRPSPQLDALLGTGGESAPDAEAPAPAQPDASGAEPPAPVDLAIASLVLTDGELVLDDRTVQPPVRTTVRDLDVAARDVRFPATQALGLRVSARLPESARLVVTGDLRPENTGDFVVELRDLGLPAFSPYAAAAGASVDGGAASLATRVRLRGSRIELENDVLLKKLGVSLRDPGSFEKQFGVPIDLALALLRDPAGNISLSIPVQMDERGTAVSIGAVVASALRQALVGALTAPLKLLGAGVSGLFGGGEGGGVAIEPLPSAPGAPALASGTDDRLGDLAKLLAERPGLQLVLRGRSGADDRPVLARQILDERWQGEGELPEVAAVEERGFVPRLWARFRMGRALAKREEGDEADLSEEEAALYQQAVEAIEVPDARLRDLATSRAEAARRALVEAGADPAHVVVGEPAPDGAPGVVIALGAG